ncbi:MAG: hypothetical protein LBU89_11180 [Fibromonadaceae bacterium]|nr:hypothetical protein [Fibromonadaceae bacterium]
MYTITVTNQNGWKNKGNTSSRSNCKCGSWKNHWEFFSNKNLSLQKCSLLGCSNPAEQAAHVFRSEEGMYEWLVPLCRSCNHPTNEEYFSLKIGAVLVNANKAETCE